MSACLLTFIPSFVPPCVLRFSHCRNVPTVQAVAMAGLWFCATDADCVLPERCCQGVFFDSCCDYGGLLGRDRSLHTSRRAWPSPPELPRVPWPIPTPVPVPVPVPIPQFPVLPKASALRRHT